MSDYKLVPLPPTPEMVSAAEDAYMPFGDMELAVRMAVLAAPQPTEKQPIEPSLAFNASVHLTNWLNMNLCECEGGHTCGYNEVKRTRDALLVAAEQQPAPDVTALVEEPISVIYIDGVGAGRSRPEACRDGINYITVADTVYWPLSAEDAQLLRSAECGRGEFTGPGSTSPDVSELVEALTELCDEIDKHEIHSVISKTSISWFKRKARKVLVAHYKGAES